MKVPTQFLAHSNSNLQMLSNSQNLIGRSLADYNQSQEGNHQKPTSNFNSASQQHLTKANSVQGSSTRIGSASGYSLRKFDPTEALQHQRMMAQQSMQILHKNQIMVNKSMRSFNSINMQAIKPYEQPKSVGTSQSIVNSNKNSIIIDSKTRQFIIGKNQMRQVPVKSKNAIPVLSNRRPSYGRPKSNSMSYRVHNQKNPSFGTAPQFMQSSFAVDS